MIKRTIEISKDPAYLSVQSGQLILRRDSVVVRSIPCEDIGVILVDHPQVTYTHHALVSLAESQATVVICGPDHLPAALVLPVSNHSRIGERLREQLGMSRPLCKSLWKQLICKKIRNQANNLPGDIPARGKLQALAANVRSGDPANVEAFAARIYWEHWLPERKFQRNSDGDGLNSLLNYGYAVLRASLARAIVAHGYLPSLGIKHSNRSNAFCLADDLIEPLRPWVDERVRQLYMTGTQTVTSEAKRSLLELLAEEVRFGTETGPLMVCLHRFVASLGDCIRGESKRLECPEKCK